MISCSPQQKQEILHFTSHVRNLILQKANIDTGIFNGASGISLFCFYYQQFDPSDVDIYDKGIDLLKFESITLNNRASENNNFTDLNWLIWTISHLKSEGIIDLDPSDYLALKPLFLNHYERYLKEGNYDLFYGFIGLSQSLSLFCGCDEYIKLSRSFFLNTVEKEGVFSKWPSLFIDKSGNYNFGLAHGMPSIVLQLVKLYELKPEEGETFRRLALSCCKYLLDKKQDYKIVGSYFPNYHKNDNSESQESRLAWCYGDLGVGYCLWKAGNVFSDEQIAKVGLEVLLTCAARTEIKSTMIADLCLCHGSSGLILFFKRLYEFTGLLEFRVAAEYWTTFTLREIRAADDITSIKVWKGDQQGYVFESGMLMGVAGIALILLEVAEGKKYSWSNWLLL